MSRLLGADDLVLCSGTVRRAGLVETARAAAAAGFGGISVYYDEYARARADGWTDADLLALLDELDLGVAELDGRMSWLAGEEVGGPDLEEFVRAAGALRARSITVLEVSGRMLGAALPYEDVVPAFVRVCDAAAVHGLLVHLEYYPLSGVDRFAAACQLARRAERPNAGVMLDTWHHLRGPDRGRCDFGADAALVTGIQVGDVAPEPGPDLRAEMMRGRRLPGDGNGDLAGIVRSLRKHGCRAPLEIEVYSAALAERPAADVARDAYDALARVSVASISTAG